MNLEYLTNPLIYIIILLIFWNIWQQIKLFSIQKKQTILFQGESAKNLEEIILIQKNQIENLEEEVRKLINSNQELIELSNTNLSKVGMVRFNPFKNLGGNQSFSIAFLNNHLNGLVISSIYSGEISRFYAKTILQGKSIPQQPLTKEEEKAIEIAIHGENTRT